MKNKYVSRKYLTVKINSFKKHKNKKLEQPKKRPEEYIPIFSRILENTPIMTVLFDRNFNFIWVNNAYARTCGYDPSFFEGKNHFDLYPDMENQTIFQNTVNTGIPFFISGKPFIYPDGHRQDITYWDWSLIPVKNETDYVTYLVLTLTDVTDRIKIEKELLESKKKYQKIFENSIVGIVQTNLKGRYLTVNPASAQMLGYESPEELMNTITDVASQIYAYPEDREKVTKELKEEGHIYNFEAQIRRKNGSVFWSLSNLHLVRDDQENILYIEGSFQDITNLKEIEETLRQSKNLLYNILEFQPDPTLVLDREEKVIFWNRAIEEITGISEKMVIGKSSYECAMYIYGDKRPLLANLVFMKDEKIEKECAFFKREGDLLYMENEILSSTDGQKRTLWAKACPMRDENGNIIGAIESFRDITRRKTMENSLMDAKNYVESLIKTANILILELDTKGNIVLLNEAGEKITGYKEDECIGKNWFDFFVHSKTYPAARDEFNRLKKTGNIIDTFENPITTKSGEERIISWKNKTLTRNGKFVGTISFGMDITENKRVQEELEKTVFELKKTLDKVKLLSGLLPICSSCKKIRNDKGYWEQIEIYIRDHSAADFTHSICPECGERLYPEYFKKNST